jgi:ABC-type phosphate/phosphonate transport system substrate-binding protein
METTVRVGVVMYDPKVATIWEIIANFFEGRNCPIDVTYFSDYDLQVSALLNREIDIAWNSPLAWVDAQRRSEGACRAIAMRDTDVDRVSHIVAKKNSGIAGLADLKGKTLAVGAMDSPQATLIPIGLLQRAGLEPGRDFQVRRFDDLVGKHGDHIGGEQKAFDCLARGEADAAAMLDLNWERWTSDGTINPDQFFIVATTDLFDHCVFTVRHDFPKEVEEKWLNVLFAMSYDNPQHREMMDMEGLKEWRPGRTTGFAALERAVEQQRFFEDR